MALRPLQLTPFLLYCLVASELAIQELSGFKLSDERIVFQTKFGDIEMALWPEVAPVTSSHILKLAKMGGYNTVDFFRVDKGFVAQCQDIYGNRRVPLSSVQEAEAKKKVPLEVLKEAKHDRRGILSMARWDDPNSGGSSFSITLGAAPHLDMKYATFGEVTGGMETLDKFEEQPTRKEGIFVMPEEPITIQSSYVYSSSATDAFSTDIWCPQQLDSLRLRYAAQAAELTRVRNKLLPGT